MRAFHLSEFIAFIVQPNRPLNYVQQPKNNHDQKNGPKSAARPIAPVARVRVGRERTQQKKYQNNDNNQFQGVPPSVS
jgi:hypothetical protein